MRQGALLAGLALALLAPGVAQAACGGTKHFSPHKRLVRGRQPLAIGDSVMLGAGKQLSAAGFEVNARGCRQVSEGLGIVARRRHNGTLPRIVILALGSNFRVTSSDIHRALRIVGPKRLLGLVTPRHEGGSVKSDAALIRAAGRHHPGRIRVLDWVRYSAGHGGWFGGDGLHLGPAGAAAMTRLLLRIVPRVHPKHGAWSGTGRTGPVGFTFARGGVVKSAVLVVNKACLGAGRIELRRSAAGFIPVAGDGSFAVSIGKGRRGRRIGLRGRFKRHNRVTGFLRVRKRGCDSGRVRWSGRPGRPRRESGTWTSRSAARYQIAFFLPRDRLSLGSSKHGALRGTLPGPCPEASKPFRLRRPVPIVLGNFALRRRLRDHSVIEVRGRFVDADRAVGSWRRSLGSACDSGPVAWSTGR
ncbi:MAG TPA: hypothetical protein VGF21_07770 [Thermoleophilaceae bacterium]|jgi:hypothetical protein